MRVSSGPEFSTEMLGSWTTEIGSDCDEISKCMVTFVTVSLLCGNKNG